jgi:hypothetical protein
MLTTETISAITNRTADVRNESKSSRKVAQTSSTPTSTDIPAIDEESMDSALELSEQLRAAKRTLILQSQQIAALESYLDCIVGLHARVRELELNESL